MTDTQEKQLRELEAEWWTKVTHDPMSYSIRDLIDAAVEIGERIGYERGRREADALIVQLENWTHTYGADLKPRGADTYGEGKRDAKDQVGGMVAAALRALRDGAQ